MDPRYYIMDSSYNIMHPSYNIMDSSYNITDSSYYIMDPSYYIMGPSYNIMGPSYNIMDHRMASLGFFTGPKWLEWYTNRHNPLRTFPPQNADRKGPSITMSNVATRLDPRGRYFFRTNILTGQARRSLEVKMSNVHIRSLANRPQENSRISFSHFYGKQYRSIF